MDKIELKVTMEPERLDALRYFLSAKEKRTPEKELQRLLEELYEKYVPADTREYLDSKNKPAVRPRPRRTAKGGRTAQTHDTDATLNELEQLRGRCVQDVMRTHGMISFKEIFRFQKRL